MSDIDWIIKKEMYVKFDDMHKFLCRFFNILDAPDYKFGHTSILCFDPATYAFLYKRDEQTGMLTLEVNAGIMVEGEWESQTYTYGFSGIDVIMDLWGFDVNTTNRNPPSSITEGYVLSFINDYCKR